MGASSRRGEVSAIRELFKSANIPQELSYYKIIDMYEESENATVDGGDCCAVYETKHLFMGVSSRTNMEGVQFYHDKLANLGWKVIPIHVKQGLHLKSFMTYFFCRPQPESFNKEILLTIFDSSIGHDIFKQIEPHSTSEFMYKAVFVPDEEACNVVNVTNASQTIIIVKEGYAKSEKILQDIVHHNENSNLCIQTILYDELSLLDGCLSCCSVLLP